MSLSHLETELVGIACRLKSLEDRSLHQHKGLLVGHPSGYVTKQELAKIVETQTHIVCQQMALQKQLESLCGIVERMADDIGSIASERAA